MWGHFQLSNGAILALNFGIPAVCWAGTYLAAYFLIFKRLSRKGKIKKAAAVLFSVLTSLFVGSILTMWVVVLIFHE